MMAEELIELLAARPRGPLRIHTSNGRTHEICHPETAIVGEDVGALGVEGGNSDRPRIRLVSIGHINEFEPISGSTRAEL